MLEFKRVVNKLKDKVGLSVFYMDPSGVTNKVADVKSFKNFMIGENEFQVPDISQGWEYANQTKFMFASTANQSITYN